MPQKHDLISELPEYREQIHELKLNDAHFAKLFEQYHAVDQEVHRIEEGVETPADDYVEQCKKERLALKDQLLVMLQKQAVQA